MNPLTPMIHRLQTMLLALGPVRAAFLASVMLSLIAIYGTVTPNNDGMLYVDTAIAFERGGLAAARELFDWLTLPVLIATLSSLAGLEAQTAAHVLCSLLLAGCCALLVASTREQFPHAGWAAFAIALALPALNAYRDHIMREPGSWFFVLLALWWALLGARHDRLLPLLGAQLSICVAALFRPECLIFLLALPLFELSRTERTPLRVLTASAGLIAGALGLLALGAAGELAPGSRLATQITSASPAHIVTDLRAGAEALAASVLNKYSADEAGSILFFGLLSILPMKFFGSLGLLVIPAAYAWRVEAPALLWRRWSLFAWCFLLYALVLLVFLFNSFFLTSRYVALLVILTAPLAAVGLHALMQRSAAWRRGCIIVAVLLAISHVVSTSPPKTRYTDSARWIVEQAIAAERLFFEEPAVSYLAGMGYSTRPNAKLPNRERAARAAQREHIDYLVLEGRIEDADEMARWAASRGLELEAEFIDGRNRAIRIFRRAGD